MSRRMMALWIALGGLAGLLALPAASASVAGASALGALAVDPPTPATAANAVSYCPNSNMTWNGSWGACALASASDSDFGVIGQGVNASGWWFGHVEVQYPSGPPSGYLGNPPATWNSPDQGWPAAWIVHTNDAPWVANACAGVYVWVWRDNGGGNYTMMASHYDWECSP